MQRNALEVRVAELGGRIGEKENERGALRARLSALDSLEAFREFRELDWRSLASEAADLSTEKTRLEESSDVLRSLTDQLESVSAALAQLDGRLGEQRERRGKTEGKREDMTSLREQTSLIANADDRNIPTLVQTRLTELCTESLGERELSVESCDIREREVREGAKVQKGESAKSVKASWPQTGQRHNNSPKWLT